MSVVDPKTSELPSVNEVSFAEISKSAKKKGAFFERHVLDEKLDDVQRLLHLLKNGTKVQKKTALTLMPSVFIEHKEDAAKSIIPFLNDTLWKENPESQILYAKHVPSIFAYLSEGDMREVYGLIKTMLTLKNATVQQAWDEVLLECIQFVPVDLLKDELMKMCIQKGSLSEAEKNRVFACRMFGAFSCQLDGHAIEELFLPKAVALCQDTAFSVRKQMAEQIPLIAKGIGLTKAKQLLFPELSQLVADETKEVKQAAFSSLVKLLDFFDSAFQKREILPIFMKWMKQPPNDLFRLLVQSFGEYVWKLSSNLFDEATISSFCNFYMKAAQHQDPTIRGFCAFNFPGVLQSIGGKRFPIYLAKTFKALCTDKEISVKGTMAAGFHEVANVLGPEHAAGFLRELFVQMLRDDNAAIQDKIVANMHVILRNFTRPIDTSKEELFQALLPELLQFQQKLQPFAWARQEAFFANFQYFGDFLPRETLIDVIIPLLKRQLTDGSTPLRHHAAKTIVIISRKLESNSKQVEIFCSLIEEFKYGRSYRNRLAFLDLCDYVMQYYSSKFFYNLFVEQVISLAKDPVSNVRRKLCEMLPKVKIRLILSNKNSKFVGKVNEIAEQLLQDTDSDVKYAATQLNFELMKIEKERAKHSGKSALQTEEAADKKKEQEERSWTDSVMSARPIASQSQSAYTSSSLPTPSLSMQSSLGSAPSQSSNGTVSSQASGSPAQMAMSTATSKLSLPSKPAGSLSSPLSPLPAATTSKSPAPGPPKPLTRNISNSSLRKTTATPKSSLPLSGTGSGLASSSASTFGQSLANPLGLNKKRASISSSVPVLPKK